MTIIKNRMLKMKQRLESKYGVNVVFEINRWAKDGPMDHADKALSPQRFPTEKYKHNFIRRLVGDYVGIPIMILNHSLAVDSVEASRVRFHKRLAAASLYDDSSIVLFAHSLGGPVAYRYLQKYSTTKVDRVISCGSMNHYANPYAGLKSDAKKKSGGKKTMWVEVQKCFSCGKHGHNLPKCTQCAQAFYCDSDCQRKHWRKHRPVCRAAVAALARRATRERLARAVRAKGKDKVEGAEEDELCVICQARPVDPMEVSPGMFE